MANQRKSVKIYACVSSLGLLAAGFWLSRSGASTHDPRYKTVTQSLNGTTSSPSSREPPSPMVVIEVADLSTGIGTNPLRVLVINGTRPVTEEALRAIASRTSVRSWPAMEVVPSDIRLHPVVDNASTQIAYLEVVPTEILDGWHGLHVESLPEPFVWARVNEDNILASGAHVARFQTESRPIVRGARIVDKPDGRQLRIEFSEPLVLKGAVESVIERGKGLENCRPMPAGPSDLQREVRLSCGSKIVESSIEMKISHGLQSRGGAGLEGGVVVPYAIAPEEWAERSDGTWWAKRKMN